jgi:hypothetical protein
MSPFCLPLAAASQSPRAVVNLTGENLDTESADRLRERGAPRRWIGGLDRLPIPLRERQDAASYEADPGARPKRERAA